MGQSSSSRRRQDHYHQNHPSSQLLSSSSSNPSLLLPPSLSPVPPPPPPPPPPANYAFAANAPYPYPAPPPHFCSPYAGRYGNPYRYSGPSPGQFSYPYYATPSSNGWIPARPSSSSSAWPVIPPPPPPPYVEHQKATTVKNVVNVQKETIRIEMDTENPDFHLVSFTFDADVDGSITIYYFGKEGENCSFSPLYPEIMPVRVPFQKGRGQKFRQPSGTGIDLGFFELEQLAKPMEEDVLPLVISAQTNMLHVSTDEQPGGLLSSGSAQITQAILEKKNEEPFQVKVVKQILWVDGVRYELREIFGIGNTAEPEFEDSDPGKECVICMSEPKDTAVLPCRHMCMCSECAKLLRLQSNKCPICRQPVEQLMEIKMTKNDR